MKRGSFFPLRRDLRWQLLILYLLFVTPVVIAGLIFDSFANQHLQDDVKAADLALAQAIAQETNSTMTNALQAVEQLAEYEVVIEADIEGMKNLFQKVHSVRPDVNLIYRLDEKGLMYFHYPVGPSSTVGADFSFRPYYQRATEGDSPLVSLGRISPTTEQPVATTVMPLWNEDKHFLGLVATNIRLLSLSNTLTSIVSEHPIDENFQITIIDLGGRIVVHPAPDVLLSDMNKKFPKVTEAVLQGEVGNLIELDDQGEEFLLSYVPIPSMGWGVIVGRPTTVAFATPLAIHRGVLAVIAVFLGIGFFFWIALSWRVIWPLQQMTTYSRAIGLDTNNSESLPHSLDRYSGRPDQIGHLIRSFINMEQAIQARLNELTTLLDTSAAVVSTLDFRTVLNRILEQVQQLLDIHICAIVALDEIQNVFRIQACRGLSKQYAEQFSVAPDELPENIRHALREGQPVQVTDTNTGQDPNFAALQPLLWAEGVHSILAIPLNTTHAPPSILLVYRSELYLSFNEQEIDLLSSFANHAAMAIENATLFARSDVRLKEQTRRLEALIHSLEDGLILEDLQGKVIYANQRINELTERYDQEITGMQVRRLLESILAHAVDKEKIKSAIGAALKDGSRRNITTQLAYPTGTRYLRLKIFTVKDFSGVPIGRGMIFRDITERRELDRMKSSLIATASHELRTPLANIKGYATTLLAEDVAWDIQEQREFLNIISQEADRLSGLVNDLLDMSRIEAGSLIISRSSCDLKELVQRAGQRVYTHLGDRLQIDFPPDLPPILVDAQRIEVVLRNLIENTVKYTPDNSPIYVTAKNRDEEIIVRVIDQGSGIPTEHSHHIFDSFYRVDNDLVRRAPGAGLGLAICRGFVHAHGGKIWLEPQEKGTCIAFSLPIVYNERTSKGRTSE